MGQALYRKYRPKSLAEIIGQEHITNTLDNAIKAGKISHAYLLTGPRGVGKTSIARILAHELNSLAYDESKMHMDIIEIDAASNRRIDEIRDLRDKVHVLPSSAKYKVYIIDEVHMLTREAFNALLKTLEEPPAHAIFILATTEAHKLPETIVSRTQHFSFKPIELDTLVGHLKTITKSEKMQIDDAALQLVAEHGDGSFRDSISLLDQARGLADSITEQHVQNLLGIAPIKALDMLLLTVTDGTPKELFDLLSELRGQGLQSSMLAKQLSGRLRQLIIDEPAYQSTTYTGLLHALLNVSASAQPDRLLELVLLDQILANNPVSHGIAPVQPTQSAAAAATVIQPPAAKTEEVSAPAKEPAPKPTKPTTPVATPKTNQEPAPATPEPTPTPESESTVSNETNIVFDTNAWPVVVAAIKKKYNTLFGILRMAEAQVEGGELTLIFKFAFHQKQINEGKNRKIISDIIREQTGQDITIVCLIAEKSGGTSAATTKDSVSSVSDIFGGAEVLES